MTHRDSAERTDVRFAGALLASAAAGVLLGVLDLMAQLGLPYPWAELADSAAVWGIAAVLLGALLRVDRSRAALCGALFLTIAVEAYYLAAVVALRDSASTLTSATTVTWLVLGVLAGGAGALAGTWLRASSRPMQACGWVVLGALTAAAVTSLG